MMREERGSVRSEKRESEVKILAVSKVEPSDFFCAMTEKTAKVRIGAMTGVAKATEGQFHMVAINQGLLQKAMFQIKSFLNFFEIWSSSILSLCIILPMVFVRPVIFTAFIAPRATVVTAIRRSMASSHIAWRDMTKPVTPMDPIIDTVHVSTCI